VPHHLELPYHQPCSRGAALAAAGAARQSASSEKQSRCRKARRGASLVATHGRGRYSSAWHFGAAAKPLAVALCVVAARLNVDRRVRGQCKRWLGCGQNVPA